MSHTRYTWESLSETQRNFLRVLAKRIDHQNPDENPEHVLLHVDICPTCKEKMRYMNATGKAVLPPRVGHGG